MIFYLFNRIKKRIQNQHVQIPFLGHGIDFLDLFWLVYTFFLEFHKILNLNFDLIIIKTNIFMIRVMIIQNTTSLYKN